MRKAIMITISAIALLLIAACAPTEPAPPQDPGMPPPDDPGMPPADDPFEQVEPPELPDVVATINGEEILGEEVLGFQNQMEMQGMPMDLETAVNQMITRKLLTQEAERRGYEVTREDVEERLEAQGLPADEAREIIEMQGMNYEDFLDEQISETKLAMLVEEIAEQVEITDEEAMQFYEEQAPMLGDEVTYEDVEGQIKDILAGEVANDILMELANDLMEEADIQLFV